MFKQYIYNKNYRFSFYYFELEPSNDYFQFFKKIILINSIITKDGNVELTSVENIFPIYLEGKIEDTDIIKYCQELPIDIDYPSIKPNIISSNLWDAETQYPGLVAPLNLIESTNLLKDDHEYYYFVKELFFIDSSEKLEELFTKEDFLACFKTKHAELTNSISPYIPKLKRNGKCELRIDFNLIKIKQNLNVSHENNYRNRIRNIIFTIKCIVNNQDVISIKVSDRQTWTSSTKPIIINDIEALYLDNELDPSNFKEEENEMFLLSTVNSNDVTVYFYRFNHKNEVVQRIWEFVKENITNDLEPELDLVLMNVLGQYIFGDIFDEEKDLDFIRLGRGVNAGKVSYSFLKKEQALEWEHIVNGMLKDEKASIKILIKEGVDNMST